MTVRFHVPENQNAYAEHMLTILVQAAMPVVMEQLEQSQAHETREALDRSA